MGNNIQIAKWHEDPNTEFNIKTFQIGSIPFDKPVKALSLNSLDKESFLQAKRKYDFQIGAGSKVVDESDLSQKFFNQTDPKVIDRFFFKYDFTAKLPRLLTYTFSFDPKAQTANRKMIESFINQYYVYSDLALAVPSVRLRKNKYVEIIGQGKRKLPEEIASVGHFLEFVNESVHSLQSKNHKPIFVPVPMSATINELVQIVDAYLEKDYLCFWFDFEGDPIHHHALGKLRDFFQRLRTEEVMPQTVTCFANVKREIKANANDPISPASDILSTLAGANIVGVNYTKPRPPSDVPRGTTGGGSQSNPNARELSSATYYYNQTSKANLQTKPQFDSYNAIVMAREFDFQANYFEDKANQGTMLQFLPRKDMIKDFENGALLRQLTLKNPNAWKRVKDTIRRKKGNQDMSDYFSTS